MTKEETKIESRDLNLWYGETQALKNITIAIPENKVTAVIGPSGCGKSTFIRCINRMNDLITDCRVTGKLIVGGRDIYDRDVDVVGLRKSIGMVFQKPNPFPMSIYDNITYGPRVHGICDKHKLDSVVETSLEAASLWDEVEGKLDSTDSGIYHIGVYIILLMSVTHVLGGLSWYVLNPCYSNAVLALSLTSVVVTIAVFGYEILRQV